MLSNFTKFKVSLAIGILLVAFVSILVMDNSEETNKQSLLETKIQEQTIVLEDLSQNLDTLKTKIEELQEQNKTLQKDQEVLKKENNELKTVLKNLNIMDFQ